MTRKIWYTVAAFCFATMALAPIRMEAQEAKTEETEKVFEKSSGYVPTTIDVYLSGMLLSADKEVDNQLGVNLPDYGMGIGFRTVGGKGYFRNSYNFGVTIGFDSWKYAAKDETGAFIDPHPQDAQTNSFSFYLDFAIGAGFYFSESKKYGMDLLAGIGLDYSGLFVYKSKPDKAVYYDYTALQASFYVPVSLRFKLNNCAITATCRYGFSTCGTYIMDNKEVELDRDAAIRLAPFEISLGVSL